MRCLNPGKWKKENYIVYGFDTETEAKTGKHLLSSIYDVQNGMLSFFEDKNDFINEIAARKYEGSIFAATNLQFDFFAIFNDVADKFKILFREKSSDILEAKTWINNGLSCIKNKHKPIRFIDTFNYHRVSVEKLGKIIGVNKLAKPEFLGRRPINANEWNELKAYNGADSEISGKFAKFMLEKLNGFGAKYKPTISGASMSIFKNRWLTGKYWLMPESLVMNIFEAYYGGRCEAFHRGRILPGKDGLYLGDYNSLYPSIMRDYEVPNPNTWRKCRFNSLDKIRSYDGFSLVTTHTPKNIYYPVLPLRYDFKLLFPNGTNFSWQSHHEIRKSLKTGVKIIKVHRTIYFKENINPFKGFIDTFYKLRCEAKANGDSTQEALKLVMNSLSGKFGQKPKLHSMLVHDKNMSLKRLNSYSSLPVRIGNWWNVECKDRGMPSFTIPAWIATISSLGRCKLHDMMVELDAIYSDTDSGITKHSIMDNKELGRLKKEAEIKDCIIVRPKFYYYTTTEGKEVSKIKGYRGKLKIDEFESIIGGKSAKFLKFVRFRESQKRNLPINSVTEAVKDFSTEDNKRAWPMPFNRLIEMDSAPRQVDNILCRSQKEYHPHKHLFLSCQQHHCHNQQHAERHCR